MSDKKKLLSISCREKSVNLPHPKDPRLHKSFEALVESIRGDGDPFIDNLYTYSSDGFTWEYWLYFCDADDKNQLVLVLECSKNGIVIHKSRVLFPSE